MKNSKPQAKDISDEMFLTEMRRVRHPWGWTTRWNMELPYPEKVVLAKAASLIRRKVIGGCACGCRGDFREPT